MSKFINKNYHRFDSRVASKSQLMKCEKGIHEFKQTKFTSVYNNIQKKEWFCMHCGINMNNR